MDHADHNSKNPHADRLMFYGRRHGRRLRPRQAEYLENGMARFGLAEDLQHLAPASLDPKTLF